jgi:hypothetical protein
LIAGLKEYKMTKLRPSENSDKIKNIEEFIAYLGAKAAKKQTVSID